MIKKPCNVPEVEEELGDGDQVEISGDAAKNAKPVSFRSKPTFPIDFILVSWIACKHLAISSYYSMLLITCYNNKSKTDVVIITLKHKFSNLS